MKHTRFFFAAFVGLLAFASCGDYTERIVCEVDHPVLPVLAMKAVNPVIRVNLIRTTPEAYTLEGLSFSLKGTTDLADIASVRFYQAGADGLPDKERMMGQPLLPAEQIELKVPIVVEKDTFSVWLTMQLKDQVNLDHRIQANCLDIRTGEGRVQTPEAVGEGLRTGVAVRQHGQDGVHTSRIPGLTTSRKGTLLAVYDARWDSSRDLQGNIDIALNRSLDGGLSWQPMQIVLDRKEWGGLPEKYNGVSDACILSDEATGNLYIAGLWMYGVLDSKTGRWVNGLTADSTVWSHQWVGKGSQPGTGVRQTPQFLIAKSTDDGVTWGEPQNMTPATKPAAWWLYAPAPGHGISLADGTLLFPTQGRDEKGGTFSNITVSKDGGKSWATSRPAYQDVTENMAVQLSDGSIMLNMRDNRNRGNAENNGRRVSVSSDLGETWTEHPSSRSALIEPTCMASLHKHIYHEAGKEKSLLLFANPNSISERNQMTLKVSFDEGLTWPSEYWILLDEWDGFGYSCITSIDEQNIGILYESSQANLVFQRININELLK